MNKKNKRVIIHIISKLPDHAWFRADNNGITLGHLGAGNTSLYSWKFENGYAVLDFDGQIGEKSITLRQILHIRRFSPFSIADTVLFLFEHPEQIENQESIVEYLMESREKPTHHRLTEEDMPRHDFKLNRDGGVE